MDKQNRNNELDNQLNYAAEPLIEQTEKEDGLEQDNRKEILENLTENSLPSETALSERRISNEDEESLEDLQVLTNKPETENNEQKRKKVIFFAIFGIIGISLIIFITYNYILSSKVDKALDQGYTYLEEEKYNDAILSFDKALIIDELLGEAYEGKAEAYLEMGDYSNAEEQLVDAQLIEYTNYGKILMALVYYNTERQEQGLSLANEVAYNNSGDNKVVFKLCDFYNQLNDYNKVIEIIEAQIFITDDQEKLKVLYNKLIPAYSRAGKIENEILNLLQLASVATGDENYLSESELYIVANPTFNLTAGEYSGPQTLELISGKQGDRLFYTIDGSNPNTNSMEYTSAITLDVGETTVKVIEVNDMGFISSPIEGNYNISKAALSEAEFLNRIYGVWYTPAILVKISDSKLSVSPRNKGGATYGGYTIEDLSENGGKIIIDEIDVNDGSRDNPETHTGLQIAEFDFGEQNDGKMKIKYHVLHQGQWFELNCGEPLGNGDWRVPDSNPDGYMTYKLN